ncbi:MAG: hypothetical protein KUG82_14465 [Pseudomonadales bacterium]|nr:hypothetical protein [Pseudomonadales bacterium]
MTNANESFRLENGYPVIIGTTCASCDFAWFPPVEFGCERCGSYGKSLIESSFLLKGTLLSFADIMPGTDTSFLLSTIELENGATIRAILGCTTEMAIGDLTHGRIETIEDKPAIRFYGIGE